MFFLGIIPARGGSKRFPQKNVAPLLGKPLLAWTISGAQDTKLSDCIISTDDELIANVAGDYGGKIPFVRPHELARDTTPSFDVVLHAVGWYTVNVKDPDYAVLLQPTSPTRTKEDINLILSVLEHQRPDYLVTVDEHNEPDGLLYAWSRRLLSLGHYDQNGGLRWYTGRPVPDIDFPEDLKDAEKELESRLFSKIPREGVDIDY